MEEKLLLQLFRNWAKEPEKSIVLLPSSGSHRKYFRIKSHNYSAIGVYNQDKKENFAFLEFTKHFLKKGIPVPKIYAENIEKNIYLLQDLGDKTLFLYISENRDKKNFSENLLNIYKDVIKQLIRFQFIAGRDINYKLCYPRDKFDSQAMQWDLNYFKYYFLKLADVPFDEQLLENDFKRFIAFLLQNMSDSSWVGKNFFIYRDFQSRNILLFSDKFYFIDYQGGRRGALQPDCRQASYDLSSLLFDAKANLPLSLRKKLLDYYIKEASKFVYIDKQQFIKYFYGYVLIRILQAFGAYGYRGYFERKEHFLTSIPFALKNLGWWLKNVKLPVKIPHLLKVLESMVEKWIYHPQILPSTAPTTKKIVKVSPCKSTEVIEKKHPLKVTIISFSYHLHGIPPDDSENGGGFVFDCRCLSNPGLLPEFHNSTGYAQEVTDFLIKKPETKNFLKHIFAIIDQAVKMYISRNYTNLQVTFGCTGGQHRSVFCANQLAEHLKKYPVVVELKHLGIK